jgi:hypothetical protein
MLAPIDTATRQELLLYTKEEFIVISPGPYNADTASDNTPTPYASRATTRPSDLALDEDSDIVITAFPPLVNNTIINPSELLGYANRSAYSSRASTRYSYILNSDNNKVRGRDYKATPTPIALA